MSRLALSLCLLASLAHAGGRARYGGTLKVLAPPAESGSSIGSTPAEIAAQSLTHLPLCRVVETSFLSPTTVRLTPLAGISVEQVTSTLARASKDGAPYRAVLSLISNVVAREGSVEFTVAAPLLDVQAILCHPALWLPTGAFRKQGAVLVPEARVPMGRAYVDAVSLTRTDGRGAERLFAQHRAHIVLGQGADVSGPMLFATYLVYQPSLGAHLKQSVEATVDRADLIRFFVHAPAQPMTSLLPMPLTVSAPSPKPAKPPALAESKEVKLFFDASLDDHRAVAERLQVKLQPLGYRVVLAPTEAKSLRAQFNAADGALLLDSVLLPPTAQTAQAVALALVGTTPADAANAPLVPLYAQGLALSVSDEVAHLARDAYGLPLLDDVFLLKE